MHDCQMHLLPVRKFSGLPNGSKERGKNTGLIYIIDNLNKKKKKFLQGLVVSIGLFWVSFMSFSYNGVYSDYPPTHSSFLSFQALKLPFNMYSVFRWLL